jgi:hypothetical protein
MLNELDYPPSLFEIHCAILACCWNSGGQPSAYMDEIVELLEQEGYVAAKVQRALAEYWTDGRLVIGQAGLGTNGARIVKIVGPVIEVWEFLIVKGL